MKPTLAQFRAQVRQAVADYMSSEGCSCCRDIDKHQHNHKRLAKLLGVRAHPQQADYFPFDKFRSNPK